MTISVEVSSPNATFSTITSYEVLGRPVANGTTFYKVQINSTSATMPNSSLIAWYTPTGNVTLVQENGQNMSASFSLLLPTLAFGMDYALTVSLPAYMDPAHVSVLNQTTVTAGPTAMSVTYYGARSVPYTMDVCGQTTTINSLLFAYGTIPGTNQSIVSYFNLQSVQGTNSTTVVLKLLSIRRA